MKNSRKASVSIFISIILLFSFSPNVARAGGVADALTSAVSAFIDVVNLSINVFVAPTEMVLGVIPGLDFLAADGSCRWNNLTNNAVSVYAGECDSGTRAVLITPTVTSSCNFQIPLTFYIPFFNTEFGLGSNSRRVWDGDAEEYVWIYNAAEKPMDETGNTIAVYRLTAPLSGGQTAVNNLLFYGDLYNQIGSGFTSLDTSSLGWNNSFYNESEGSEVTPITTFSYSSGCVGNVCKFVDAAVPNDSYVVYFAKILGSYTALPGIQSHSDSFVNPYFTADDLFIAPNKFLNITNGSTGKPPEMAVTNEGVIVVDVGSATAGPYQTGTASCPCTSAANACGQTNTGVTVAGVCNATVPANPAGYGSACTSAANVCGQTNTGAIQCNGSCSASVPSNASCPVPSVTFTASPTSIAYGGRSTLTWASSNATSCTAGGPWSNSGSLSGSGLTDALTANTTFTFQCTGTGGTSALLSVTVTVGAAASCTLPWGGSIVSGASATAYQTSIVTSPATCSSVSQTRTCTNGTLSGSYTNQSCLASCVLPWGGTIASGASATAYQTPSVNSPAACSSVAQTRTCSDGTLSGSYTNQSCLVMAPCTLPWGGSLSSGSSVTAYQSSAVGFPLTCSSVSETRSCSNGTLSGSYTSQSCAATTASLSANPATIVRGQSSTLTWSSTNATSCTAVGGFSTGEATSGSASVSPLTTSNYQISCAASGGGSSPSNVATITVLQPEATITASPTRVVPGSNSTITWSSSLANSCAVSGPGLSSTDLSGARSVAITSQSTFTITCQTDGSPVSGSVIVNVTPGFQEF